MTHWHHIKESIDRFILWTKDSVLINAAAKIALQNIPVVGQTLADLYDSAAESGEQETNAAVLQEIIARLDALGETGFQKSVELIENSMKLREARERLKDLHEEVRKIRKEMEPMVGILERLETELLGFSWGASNFDPASNADQATFLILLKASLDRSKQIFSEQLRISQSILQNSHDSAPSNLLGLDDRLWWMSKNNKLSPADQPAFRELRKVTDRMRAVNLRVRGLIRQNILLLPKAIPTEELVPIQELEIHLSTWLAKYEYLREHDNEHMALIFVGVAPTNIPFPPRVDPIVTAALRTRMKAAGLEHILH